MKIYEVTYNSFEGHNTQIFFCNKAEAKKWIREHQKNAQKVLNDPDNEPSLWHLKSTKKKDIVDFINFHTAKP